MATIVAVTTLAALTASSTPATSPTERNYKESYRYMRTLANRYHHQRDNLQQRLTRRVLEVRRLQGRIRELVHHKTPRRDVTYAIKLAAAAYGVSEWEMHRVASCESGHYALARNGQYRGVFQEGPMFESGPFGRAGFSVWDPVANAMTAAVTVAREGWSQWSCKP